MPIGNKGIRKSGQRDRSATSRNSNRGPAKGRRDNGKPKSLANAKQKYERYLALARDTASSGDPIEVENFNQHAEHYFRLMQEQARQGTSH